MATPPTFIQEAETAWNNATDPKTTASFEVVADDVLVAFGIIEDANFSGSARSLAISGGTVGLSWSQAELMNTSAFCWVSLWTAVVVTGGSMDVTFDINSAVNSPWFGGNVLTFRGSDGVGASDQAGSSSNEPSLALTTLHDNSVVVAVNGDWNAVDGATRVWRTVNSVTPTAGNGLERTYFTDSSHYTTYGAYWSDVGAAGSKTVGLSAPGGQKWSLAAVEVRGAATPPPPPPPAPWRSPGGVYLAGGRVLKGRAT